MENNVQEIISNLYDLIRNAWSLPLGAEKCVIERDRVLDMLDEISNQLPSELTQAKTIVESRNEVISNAKHEAENIIRQAEEKAKQLVSENEVYKQAQVEAHELMKSTQDKIMELRRVTNQYVDDAMKRTEETIAQALGEVRNSRSKFATLTGSQPKQESPIIEDI
ncbi:MAG: hypothetical protein IJS31_07400 [Oscillospiraceae bacterium]|nr:hypothetical protein [Oscillospiraceae bacterium]